MSSKLPPRGGRSLMSSVAEKNSTRCGYLKVKGKLGVHKRWVEVSRPMLAIYKQKKTRGDEKPLEIAQLDGRDINIRDDEGCKFTMYAGKEKYKFEAETEKEKYEWYDTMLCVGSFQVAIDLLTRPGREKTSLWMLDMLRKPRKELFTSDPRALNSPYFLNHFGTALCETIQSDNELGLAAACLLLVHALSYERVPREFQGVLAGAGITDVLLGLLERSGPLARIQICMALRKLRETIPKSFANVKAFVKKVLDVVLGKDDDVSAAGLGLLSEFASTASLLELMVGDEVLARAAGILATSKVPKQLAGATDYVSGVFAGAPDLVRPILSEDMCAAVCAHVKETPALWGLAVLLMPEFPTLAKTLHTSSAHVELTHYFVEAAGVPTTRGSASERRSSAAGAVDIADKPACLTALRCCMHMLQHVPTVGVELASHTGVVESTIAAMQCDVVAAAKVLFHLAKYGPEVHKSQRNVVIHTLKASFEDKDWDACEHLCNAITRFIVDDKACMFWITSPRGIARCYQVAQLIFMHSGQHAGAKLGAVELICKCSRKGVRSSELYKPKLYNVGFDSGRFLTVCAEVVLKPANDKLLDTTLYLLTRVSYKSEGCKYMRDKVREVRDLVKRLYALIPDENAEISLNAAKVLKNLFSNRILGSDHVYHYISGLVMRSPKETEYALYAILKSCVKEKERRAIPASTWEDLYTILLEGEAKHSARVLVAACTIFKVSAPGRRAITTVDGIEAVCALLAGAKQELVKTNVLDVIELMSYEGAACDYMVEQGALAELADVLRFGNKRQTVSAMVSLQNICSGHPELMAEVRDAGGFTRIIELLKSVAGTPAQVASVQFLEASLEDEELRKEALSGDALEAILHLLAATPYGDYSNEDEDNAPAAAVACLEVLHGMQPESLESFGLDRVGEGLAKLTNTIRGWSSNRGFVSRVTRFMVDSGMMDTLDEEMQKELRIVDA